MFNIIGNISRSKSVFVKFLASYMLILVIPLGVGSVAYLKAGRIVEQEASRYNIAMLQQAQQAIDTQLMDMKQFALEISYNPNVQAMLDGDNSDDIKQRQLVIKTLDDLFRYKSMNQFIYDIYIFFDNSDLIISPRGQWYPLFFYNNLYRYKDMGYDQWYSYLTRKDGFNGYIPLQTVYTGKWPENIITYVQPLMWQSKTYAGNLVMLISERKIYDMLKKIELVNHGMIYVVDSHNNLIASTENNYDAMSYPLDKPEVPQFDNLLGTEGTIHAVYNGQDVVVSYAVSYASDWRYVSVMPNKIFMDKVEYIRSFTLTVMVVCLLIGLILAYFLAYKNYNPLKELINAIVVKVGQANKPMYRNEYDFIKDMVVSAVDESQKIKAALISQQPVLKANFIYRLMHGRIGNPANIYDSIDFFGMQFISDIFAVMLFNVDDCSEFIKSDLEQEWALVRFVITNVVEELGNRYGKAYMIEMDRDQLALLLNFYDINAGRTADIMINIADDAKRFLGSEFHFILTIGIGDVHRGISSIEASYREAVTSLKYKIAKGSNSIICYSDIHESDQNYYYPLEVELQLINYIKAGELEKAEAILDSVFKENFIEKDLPYRLIQCLFFDIMSTAIKTLNEIKVDYMDVFGPSFNPVAKLLECETVSEMHHTVMEIYRQICRYIDNNRKSHNIELRDKILAYIEEHYDDVNLGVATIADHFGLNPSYLSYFFKEQMEQNMTDYINSVRLKKAKELLKDRSLSINEVAMRIGYGTAARFIRVFKKDEGITPGEYRNGMAL